MPISLGVRDGFATGSGDYELSYLEHPKGNLRPRHNDRFALRKGIRERQRLMWLLH